MYVSWIENGASPIQTYHWWYTQHSKTWILDSDLSRQIQLTTNNKMDRRYLLVHTKSNPDCYKDKQPWLTRQQQTRQWSHGWWTTHRRYDDDDWTDANWSWNSMPEMRRLGLHLSKASSTVVHDCRSKIQIDPSNIWSLVMHDFCLMADVVFCAVHPVLQIVFI